MLRLLVPATAVLALTACGATNSSPPATSPGPVLHIQAVFGGGPPGSQQAANNKRMAEHAKVVIQGAGGTWTLTTDSNGRAWVDLGGDSGTIQVWLAACQPPQKETMPLPATGTTITVGCGMR